MRHRRLLGLALGVAAIVAIVVPATADAETETTEAGEAVIVEALAPGATKVAPTSSAPQGSTGEITPTSDDATEPLPGGPEPQIIIGNDTRTKVMNTSVFPGSAVALLEVDPTTGPSFRCTGWFISADAVATAAHCLNWPAQEGAVYTVTPGWDGDSGFASCSNLEDNTVYASNSWVSSNGQGPAKDDYAALNLDQSVCPDYSGIGHFGFRQVGDANIKGLKETLTGYPADKATQQWQSTGKIRRASKNLVFYKNDTFEGMSGSPVYKNFNNCGTCAVAIHTSGFATPENGGTRVRPKVGRFLNTVKNLP